MTAVLCDGWWLWCESGTRLLCPGEALDGVVDEDAIRELVRLGRAELVVEDTSSTETERAA